MKPMRTQPFFKYAIERLPADSHLEQAVAEYLGMRLNKDPTLHPKVWEACIDELIAGMRIDVKSRSTRPKQRVVGKQPANYLIPDLIYLFQVATLRGWNHVYFTQEQDTDWSNMSFYQDPYWYRLTRDKESRRILEEVLNGTGC